MSGVALLVCGEILLMCRVPLLMTLWGVVLSIIVLSVVTIVLSVTFGGTRRDVVRAVAGATAWSGVTRVVPICHNCEKENAQAANFKHLREERLSVWGLAHAHPQRAKAVPTHHKSYHPFPDLVMV